MFPADVPLWASLAAALMTLRARDRHTWGFS
jgi:hypothetical protein